MLRSRWAALGAAVAVSLGAGGIGLVQADLAAGERPVTVTVTPKRVLDTRTDLGLAGAFSHASPRDVQITGSVQVATSAGPASDTVVPVGATGVVVNVTVVRPSASGFLSLRPAGATGTPTTSNLNFTAGSVVPNSATVDLGTNGKLQVWVSLDPGSGSVHVLVDIVGYTIDHNHDDRYYTDVEVDDLLASIPAGPKGDTGAPGAPGADAAPARVIWVADDGTGDFTSLSAALESITDNSVSKPYLIRIAPGVYPESDHLVAKSHVDIEGSGQGVTTITCACPTDQPTGPDAVLKLPGSVEIRQLTIENTGGGQYSQGVIVNAFGSGRVSIRDVTVLATGGTQTNFGLVYPSSADLINVSIEASGGSSTFGIYHEGESSPPTLRNVTITASGASSSNIGMYNNYATSPRLTDVTVTASGGNSSWGLYNVESSPSVRDSTIVADGSNGIGVYNIHDGTTGFGASPNIRGSVVIGSTNSIFTTSDSSAKVADTTLDGPRGGTGTYTCVGVHNSAFVALNTTCS